MAKIYPNKRQKIEIVDDIKLDARKTGFATKLIGGLYLDESTADVFFMGDNENELIPAHKNILAKASKVFHKLFYVDLTDFGKVVVELPNLSPKAIEEFLQFFYLNEVKLRIENVSDVVELIKKYELPDELVHGIPHAQHSKNHILNALNNDCIQAVLGKLTNALDYMNAANVCTKFQENAIVAYPSAFQEVYIRDEKEHSNTLSPLSVRNFVSIFGSLIKSIDWVVSRNLYNKMNHDTLDVISYFCGLTLTELRLTGFHLDFNVITSPFMALEMIDLTNFRISNFGFHPNLITLYLSKDSAIDDIIRNYPKLEDAVFVNGIFALNERNLIEFLHLNPQLKQLHVDSPDLTSTIFLYLPELVPNLNLISFTLTDAMSAEMLTHLGRLQKLKGINILFKRASTVPFLDDLIDAFIDNGVNIEELFLHGGFKFDLTRVRMLKSLQTLTVNYISESSLVDAVKHLPKLETIKAQFHDLTPAGIEKALFYGTKLKYAIFTDKQMIINSHEYQAILNLAKERVIVEIHCQECNIPSDLLQRKHKWLQIRT